MKRLIVLHALLTASTIVNAVPVALQANYQVSNGAALSSLVWNGANAGTAWGMSVGMLPSNATWTWDGTALASAGLFWTTSHINSNPLGSPVLSDRVVDLVIAPTSHTVTATNYRCVEGTFILTVGAHGCAGVTLGSNAAYNSSVTYNVGGNANCVNRTIAGDDLYNGPPRGLVTAGATGGCDAVFGAFDLFTVAASGLNLGDTVILSETASLAQINACKALGSGSAACVAIRNETWLEFQVVPVPAALWLLGSALGVLGFLKRRAHR
jgi:hypothetical protein